MIEKSESLIDKYGNNCLMYTSKNLEKNLGRFDNWIYKSKMWSQSDQKPKKKNCASLRFWNRKRGFVEILLQTNADVNLMDEKGKTALLLATPKIDSTQLIDLLIRKE